MASPGLMAAVVARYLSEHGFAAASAAFDLEAAPLLSRWETEAGAPGGGRLVAKALSELLAEYAELWGRESRRHALCAANPALTPMLAVLDAQASAPPCVSALIYLLSLLPYPHRR